MITAERYHDISCGHRVCGHESKCAHLHGHNYRIHFTIAGDIDGIGRVLDFSVIKNLLCEWLERTWDHKFLIWVEDPLQSTLKRSDYDGVVLTSFNPTAENMAKYLLEEVGPEQLINTNCLLLKVRVEETRKCSAEASLDPYNLALRLAVVEEYQSRNVAAVDAAWNFVPVGGPING